MMADGTGDEYVYDEASGEWISAAEANAKARGHVDCVKGIAAFLNKTKPTW